MAELIVNPLLASKLKPCYNLEEYKCHSYKHSGHKEIAMALVVFHPV